MSNKTASVSSPALQADASELSLALSEARRQLAAEVKMRRDCIKPMEQALRALKNPHTNAVALYEASLALQQPAEGLALPKGYQAMVNDLRTFADAQVSELEFTFARDLREKHHLVIDPGYGKIRGKTFRLSNMGDETEETVSHLLACLDDVL